MLNQSEEIVLPSGETVTVRGLSSMEGMLLARRREQAAADPDVAPEATLLIGWGVLAATSVRDAEKAGTAWMLEHSIDDFSAAAARINTLSGTEKGAAKSDLPGAGDD